MTKSLVFLGLLFLLNTGFVNYEKVENGGDRQQKFLEFLSYFEKVSLPYALELNELPYNKISKNAKLDNLNDQGKSQGFYGIAQAFLPLDRIGKFSRIGRPIIQPVARFFPDDKTVAVIYKSSMQFSSYLMNEYTIAYYDLKGNLFGRSKKRAAFKNYQQIGFTNMHQSQIFTIFPSGKIETVLYNNHWEKKLNKVAIEQNKVVGFRKVKQTDYELVSAHGIQEIGQVEFTARP